MDNLIINNLTKEYKNTTALNKVSLEINPGIYGLLGPNGAGKTTLMRVIATILEPTDGIVLYRGIPITKNNQIKKFIGYLPQKFSMYKNLTIEETLTHIAVLKDIKVNINESITEVLEYVNLNEVRKKKIGELSGGMLRRVGIAQATLGNPEILIIDEPTAGLDPEERIRFKNLLSIISRNSIIIISTHLVEDIETLCDNIGVLNKGNMLFSGKTEELIKKYNSYCWELKTTKGNIQEIEKQQIVSTTYRSGDSFVVRILSKKIPFSECSHCDISLEEAYLCLLKGI